MTEFPPRRIMDFFEEAGCPLKTERGTRVFPVSDKAQSILETLQKEMRKKLHRKKHFPVKKP
jgi:predicted flavoprotein YhiN